MSNYEFWDDLGRIFNLVSAYQEKSIEFNKRFINPWIRLGNVFDRQDRSREAIEAYKRALEIDPSNAASWCDLGSAYFKAGDHTQAVDAFEKAIELNPRMGWAYSNLALTYAAQDRHPEAVSLYQKSIELLEQDADKAVSWNRLGNLYRKMNEYDLAVEAFQKADQLDKENAGFREPMGEAPQGTAPVDEAAQVLVSPIQLIVEESHAEEAALAAASAGEEDLSSEADAPAPVVEEAPVVDEPPSVEAQSEPVEQAAPALAVDEIAGILGEITAESTEVVEQSPEPVAEAVPAETPAASEPASEASAEPEPQAVTEEAPAAPQPETEASSEPEGEVAEPAPVSQVMSEEAAQPEAEVPAVDKVPAEAIEAVDAAPCCEESTAKPVEQATPNPEAEEVPSVQNVVETYTESPLVADTSTETGSIFMAPEAAEVEAVVPAETPAAEAPEGTMAEAVEAPEPGAASEPVVETAAQAKTATEETAQPTAPQTAVEVAYDEFLKDDQATLASLPAAPLEEPAPEQASVSAEPLQKIDASGDLRIEMNTKNAHVWNELGNVYFNKGAVDDSIVAYSKAIELDRWFAWPYSNLALAYVQKGRFAEAVLLYQRSIELFSGEKDKAVSWNRLGNVYRRMADYDSAIAAYQRADELDPDNSTLSLQSRFSLLGNFQMEQSPSYAAA